MAISLNNHETRIKALEDKSPTTRLDVLLTNSGYNNGAIVTVPNLSQYALLIFNSFPTSDPAPRVCGTSILTYQHFKTSWAEPTGRDHYIRYQYVNDTQIKIREIIYGKGGCCYGLKLYYSFSYNIIYRVTACLFNLFSFAERRCKQTIWL